MVSDEEHIKELIQSRGTHEVAIKRIDTELKEISRVKNLVITLED